MSLKLHVAAQPSELLNQLRSGLARAQAAATTTTDGIPSPIPVVVSSTQVSEWLQIRLARDRGVCMGFRFQPLTMFLRQVQPASDSALALNRSFAAWSGDALRWRLLPLVESVVSEIGHPAGEQIQPRTRFAFARLLAAAFDKYGRYRPEWLGRWASGSPAELASMPSEAWQAELWRKLAAKVQEPHPAIALRRVEKTGDNEPGHSDSNPLFIVFAGPVDPLTIEVVHWLSATGYAVSVHSLLPSLGFLGDVSRRNAAVAAAAETNPDGEAFGAHPLLASLGQEAVGTFSLLGQLSDGYSEWPDVGAPPSLDGASLLTRLQVGVRHELPPIGAPRTPDATDARPVLADDDISVRLHACHSPRRELEVVRDELLRAFADIPDLRPGEVLVATTKFDVYAPLAEGVLKSGARSLPIRLTAIPGREANPIAAGTLALLRLALGRCCASEIIELLNLPAVQARLEADSDAVAHLADLVRNSGLTHGCDASHRGSTDDTGTWRAALDRILAGVWFGPQDCVSDAAGRILHPVASDHGDDSLDLRFTAWLTELARQLSEWPTNVPASEWAQRLGGAADALLYSEELDDAAVAFRRELGELAHVAADTPLDTGAILDWLEEQLENANSLRTTISGDILFGRVDQVHALPCRVLVILGLQDGSFPRAGRRAAWDLLGHKPRPADSDPRTRDRQLFLDALLAPADRLILTASNRSLHTGHDGPWSSCVEELLRIATQTVRPARDDVTVADQLVVRHRIHPFSIEYFSTSALPRSFDSAAAQIVRDLSVNAAPAPRPFWESNSRAANLPATEQVITLDELIDFWKDPARAWLQSLQVELPRDEVDDTELDAAPLSLNALQRYGLYDRILNHDLAADPAPNPSRLIARLSADRSLPPAALGALLWKAHQAELAMLTSVLRGLIGSAEPLSVDIKVTAELRLVGQVRLLRHEPAVLAHRPGKYKDAKHRLRPFVESLAATVTSGKSIGCVVLGLDVTTPAQKPGLAVAQAQRRLFALVEGYIEGRRRPLTFAPTASSALAGTLADGGDNDAAVNAASEAWYKEPYKEQPGGEGLEPAATLAWRDADPFAAPHADQWIRWATEIASPLQSWWEAR